MPANCSLQGCEKIFLLINRDGRNLFSQKTVNLWNLLLQAMKVKSLGIFKAEADRFLVSQGMKGYGEKENGSAHDEMAEQTHWAKWSNSAPISYGLVGAWLSTQESHPILTDINQLDTQLETGTHNFLVHVVQTVSE